MLQKLIYKGNLALTMSIKKWKDFNHKSKTTKVESDKGIEINKSSEKEDLADDLTNIQKAIEKSEKLEDGEWEIVGINDVSLDDPEISEATIINADLGGKEAKRGDILYITAMVQKKNASWNSMAVLKVRVVDMYKGLSILNTLK